MAGKLADNAERAQPARNSAERYIRFVILHDGKKIVPSYLK